MIERGHDEFVNRRRWTLMRGRRAAKLAVGSLALLLVFATGVFAYFLSHGTGAGSASVGVLDAPANVTAKAGNGSTGTGPSPVTITWDAPSAGVTPTGFQVKRDNGSTQITLSCSSSPCTDTGVLDGTYTYHVRSLVGTSWTSTTVDSNQLVIQNDTTPPTTALSLVAPGHAFLSGGGPYTLFFKSDASGSFHIADAVTDSESGPASASFPAVNATGWSGHTTAELVNSGAGSAPTITYTSSGASAYTWAAGASTPSSATVTATDGAGNPTNDTITFTSDTTGPTGAALKVNGTSGTSGGSTSLTRASSYSIDTRTDYNGDAGSGLATSVLTVAYAPWSTGACGTFGPSSTVTGTPSQSEPSGDGCYRYALTGTDNVGNVSSLTTTVKVDTAAPATSITLNPSSPNGLSSWYKTTAPTFALGAGDAGSGVAASFYRIDSGITQTYSSAVTIPDGQHAISYWSTDQAGNTESTHTTGTIKVDSVKPTDAISIATGPTGAYLTGGTLYYKGNAPGSFSFVDTVGDGTSGPASATFPAIATTGWTHAVETVSTPSGGPYSSTSYSWTASPNNPSSKTITGADVAGNASTGAAITFTSDTTGPTGGALTVNGTAASAGGSSSLTKAGGYAINARTDFNGDAGSGFATSALTVAYAPWSGTACGTFGSPSTVTGTPSQSEPSGDGCYRYVLTGTDNVGNVSSLMTTVQVDTTSPATSDNTAAIGNSWKNSTQTVTLSPTDAGSGVAHTYYTIDGSTPSVVAGVPQGSTQTGTSISLSATGQYTIKYFSVDSAGNSETAKTAGTVIRIDKIASTDAVSTVSGSGIFQSGTTIYFNKNTGGSFKLTDAVTDADSGAASATFPGISATGWSGHTAAEIVTSGTGTNPVTYTSGTYTFGTTAVSTAATVTSKDVAGNNSTGTAFTFTADAAGPSGGTVTVPSFVNTTSVTVTFNAGSDPLSGVNAASGQLSRASATYNSGVDTCGSFGAFTNIGAAGATSPYSDNTVSANTCYEYKYTVSDNVSNSTTYTSGGVAVDTVAPTVTSVTLSNGGSTAGRIEKGDTINIVFSEQMSVSSICSTWSGDTTNQSNGNDNGVTATMTDGTGATNDSLTVSWSAGTCHFGSIDLGSNAYVSGGNLTFSGSGSNRTMITWNATTHTLSVTLGASSGSGTPATVNASTAVYTPGALITDSAGNAVTGTASTGNVKNF